MRQMLMASAGNNFEAMQFFNVQPPEENLADAFHES